MNARIVWSQTRSGTQFFQALIQLSLVHKHFAQSPVTWAEVWIDGYRLAKRRGALLHHVLVEIRCPKVEGSSEVRRVQLNRPLQVLDRFGIIAQRCACQPEIKDCEHVVGTDVEGFLEFCHRIGEL